MINKMIMASLAAVAALAGLITPQISSGVSTQAASGIAPDTGSSRVVVELFTSQGCSSCPPADTLAQRLSKDPSLLVITRPVTYWDRLGWKDTLAKESNTQLQRAYATKNLAGAGVYTPQMVVNGGGGAIGSRESEIRGLARAARSASAPIIDFTESPSGIITLRISGKSQHIAQISLVALSSSETVKIGRGENGGRILHYTNVVKSEHNLGSWTGGTKTFKITPAQLRQSGADKYAAIVQRPGAGAIITGRMLPDGAI